jgi:hypothetical protein
MSSLTFQRFAAWREKVVRLHSREVREEVGVVMPEVGEKLCIFVHPQELTDDLDGEDFGVVERGGGTACSEASEVGYAVVYKAKDGDDDEGVKIQESVDLLVAWVGLGATERREVLLSIQPFRKTCTRG